MSDMMRRIADLLKKESVMDGVTIKPYYRPESLAQSDPSLAIVPIAPPKQHSFASDRSLNKEFTYQMNIEASTKARCTEIALAVEKVMVSMGFHQLNGGLDEYFIETNRYVDARRYRGYSSIYDTDY
ncbi:hypothetical protein [Streptococcus suis]|uniref:hypothetical protein n=1 Tax=Streptococcus suis TaxID=1307 RepID=UPI00240F6B8C|nr:hypothetical protein [Streptococcus suis]MDG3136269.1 hypothetical protein [Streptococcus suis]